MRPIVALFVVFVLLTATACRAHGARSPAAATFDAPKATIDAWKTSKAPPPLILPTATPFPTPPQPFLASPEVRHCGSSDLDASVTTGGQGFTMHETAMIYLGNRSETPCRLNHLPDIQFLDSDGNLVPLGIQPATQYCSRRDGSFCISTEPLLMLPDLPVDNGTVRPGQAYAEIDWLDTRACAPPPRVARAIRLWLPEGGGQITVDIPSNSFPDGIAPCGNLEVLDYSGVPGP
jgi:Protein of unknown function (DUF4232)